MNRLILPDILLTRKTNEVFTSSIHRGRWLNPFQLFVRCLLAIAPIMLSGCAVSDAEKTPEAPSYHELCQLLGRDPDADPLCAYTDGLRSLLEAEFPPGQATKSQVEAVLGPFHVDTLRKSTGGTSETYVVVSRLLTPIRAVFVFDVDGVLVGIVISD